MSHSIRSPHKHEQLADFGLAAWSLVLPSVGSVLCHATNVPAWLSEFLRHGADVDLVVPTTVPESALGTAPMDNPTWKVLRQPCTSRHYELAVLWDPSSASEIGSWLEEIAALSVAPDEIAVWSRNPWSRRAPGASSFPNWPLVDRCLHRSGWKVEAKFVGLPGSDRLRQIVDWHHYSGASLVKHRRRHRAWKRWVIQQPLYRWFLPVRLLRATRRGQDLLPSILDRVLETAARACGEDIHVQCLQVSPNGVAIVHVERGARGSSGGAILKVPLMAESEPRVDNNAAGLKWVAEHASRLGEWATSPPRLLGRGAVGGWTYTLEERVEGGELQAWEDPEAEAAMTHLAGFLEKLADLGESARALDRTRLEQLCGSHLRATLSLLEPELAQRLHEVWEWVIQTLDGAAVPLVPRHGDFKLENVLGERSHPERLRILDWELWTPRGLPLLDVLHLVTARRRRQAGVSMGGAVRRWLLEDGLTVFEKRLVQQSKHQLDPRYVQVAPFLYWLERIGPVAARGSWPSSRWLSANVLQTLEAMHPVSVEVGS